jgi:hypothetical protein
MNLITLDFETFYEQGFSLSNLTTEEYIRHERFQVIGVGIKVNDEETRWVTGSHNYIKTELDRIDWSSSILLCHNTQFDGAILSFIFNIVPAIYLDTLGMARAKHGVDVGAVGAGQATGTSGSRSLVACEGRELGTLFRMMRRQAPGDMAQSALGPSARKSCMGWRFCGCQNPKQGSQQEPQQGPKQGP